MRRVLVLLTLMTAVLGVASAAMAEHNTIDPFGGRSGPVQPLEHKTIDPWEN
jgi:hypothetical protein